MSRALELDLRAKLQRGMQVWLDKDGVYSQFVDELRRAAEDGSFDPVVGYRGSFLRMLLELEGHSDGSEDTALLIHLPGFNNDEVRETPLLPYYKAGRRYQHSLRTLIENAAAGHIDPDEIQRYLDEGPHTLRDADVWLAQQLGESGDGLSHLELAWIWERLAKGEVDKLPEPAQCLLHLRTVVSLDLAKTGRKEIYEARADRPDEQLRTLADALAAWCMAIEYVKDLRRAPVDADLTPLGALNQVYKDAAIKLVGFLRNNHPEEYVRIATDFEAKIEEERRAGAAEDLGTVDTFSFEDERMMRESLERLIAGDGENVAEWAEGRRPERSIWLRQVPSRAAAWTLIRAAAQLDAAIAQNAAPLEGAVSLDEATERYRTHLWRVDAAHRELEQKRSRLHDANLPQFSLVKAMLDAMRTRHHQWADEAARRFSGICEKENRFLPPKNRQQRELFEQEVKEAVKANDRVAYMLLDGFRFEMAKELIRRLDDGTKFSRELGARLSELPSVTAVGMNVLAPVSDHGRLSPIFKEKSGAKTICGFRNNNFNVTNPDTRRTAIYRRIGKNTCPLLSLDEVLDHANLRGSLAGDGIAVVHSLDLDEAGEVGQGTAAFESILMRMANAIRALREAGVNRFVITADHGFLLEPPPQTVDVNGTTGARYRFGDVAENGAEVLSVALADLAYDGVSGYATFPRGIACFKVPGGPRNYVHGGNSLQERVIPVLKLTYPQPKGGTDERYRLEARKQTIPGAGNRVKLQLRREQRTLGFSREMVQVSLEALEPGASVEVTNVGAGAEIDGDSTVSIAVGADFEVDFVVHGTHDGRTRVALRSALSSAGRAGQFDEVELAEYFPVIGRLAVAAPVSTSGSQWAAIDDEGARLVLQHIERHGAITEQEATKMLGGAREFRRFSRNVEQFKEYLSFGLRAEPGPAGKRYVKE